MEAVCPSCGKKYQIADSAAGKRAQCSGCKQVFVLQAAGATPQAKPAPSGQAPAAGSAPVPPVQPEAGATVPALPPLSSPAPLDDPMDGGAFGTAPLGSPGPLDGLLDGDPSAAPLASGPLLQPARRRRKVNTKPYILAAAGAGGAVVLVFLAIGLVKLIGGIGGGKSATAPGGPVDWAGWSVPSEAKAVMYFDVDRLRESRLFSLIQENSGMSGAMGRLPNMPWQTAQLQDLAENFQDVFIVMLPDEKPIIVLRTHDDLSLDGLVGLIARVGSPNGSGEVPAGALQPQTHAGFEYVGFPDGFLAKTADRTFCGTAREADLHAALGRRRRGEKAQLGDTLRRALDSARGDHFIAMLSPAGGPTGASFIPGPAAIGKPEWLGFGFSVNSHISVEGAVGLPSEEQAAKVKREFDEGVDKMESQLANAPPNAPPQMREMADKMLSMIRALKLSQSGNVLSVRGSWSVRDIEDLVNQAKSNIPRGARPGPPGFRRPGS